MSTGIHAAGGPRFEPGQLMGLLARLTVTVFLLGIVVLTVALLGNSPALRWSAAAYLLSGSALAWAYAQARRGALQVASYTTSGSLFLCGLLHAAYVPASLPFAVMLPVGALLLVLPYLSPRSLHTLSGLVWVAIGLAFVLAALARGELLAGPTFAPLLLLTFAVGGTALWCVLPRQRRWLVGVLTLGPVARPLPEHRSPFDRYPPLRGVCADPVELAETDEFRGLFNSLPDATLLVTPDGTIRDVNAAACQFYGLEHASLVGLQLGQSDLISGEHRAHLLEQFPLLAAGAVELLETVSLMSNGQSVPVELRASQIDHKGERALLVHVRDLSALQAAAAQLYSLANQDMLTRLPNRGLFLAQLEQTLDQEKRYGQAHSAIIFLDLDYFKSVNDSLGHTMGDELLILVAQRLRDCLRPDDLIARVGDDEFAILLKQIHERNDIGSIAARLQDGLHGPMQIGGHHLQITASMGIAFSALAYAHARDLLRDASTAMYYAKELGRARFIVFEPSMQERTRERLQIRTELPQALERGELCLFYQPIVALATGRLVGFEALVRWQHPQRGLLLPGMFIPLAEEIGVIPLLGQWVLGEVCRQARYWTEDLGLCEEFRLYVNLSGREFCDPGLVQRIEEVLTGEGLGRFRLKLEITEGVMMDDANGTIATLQSLRRLGIELCIDDFGTGYSSLRYLQRFPVQTVKIDHSFVQQIGQDRESISIVKAIVLLSHTLGLDVVAEWIEHPDQLAELEAMGCEYGQGFLFSRPLDSQAAGLLLAGQQRSVKLGADGG